MWEYLFGASRIFLVLGRQPAERGWSLMDLETGKHMEWIPEGVLSDSEKNQTSTWRRIA